MKLLAIVGEPATGKSTLVKMVMEKLGKSVAFEHGPFKGTRHPQTMTIVLGLYEGHAFPGTDRLSMGISEQHTAWLIAHLKFHYPAYYVLFEGDRLATVGFLSKWADRKVFRLSAPLDLLAERHKARGDNQTPRFLKSRATKLNNLEKKVGPFEHREMQGQQEGQALFAELLRDLCIG